MRKSIQCWRNVRTNYKEVGGCRGFFSKWLIYWGKGLWKEKPIETSLRRWCIAPRFGFKKLPQTGKRGNIFGAHVVFNGRKNVLLLIPLGPKYFWGSIYADDNLRVWVLRINFTIPLNQFANSNKGFVEYIKATDFSFAVIY